MVTLREFALKSVCGGELLMAGGESTVRWLTIVFRMVWREGKAPLDWRRAIMVPLQKKGSELKCQNYRGISLLSAPGKVYAKVLSERVKRQTSGWVNGVAG